MVGAIEPLQDIICFGRIKFIENITELTTFKVEAQVQADSHQIFEPTSQATQPHTLTKPDILQRSRIEHFIQNKGYQYMLGEYETCL